MAGYFDADGYVRFNNSVRMEIKSVFPWILSEFQARFGGTVRQVKSTRNTWAWSASGSNAERALLALIPFLYVKKEQALLCLKARRLRPGPERQSLLGQLKALRHCNYENV